MLLFAIWIGFALVAPQTPATQQFVVLKPGTSTRQIASELEHAGAIRSSTAFLLYHYLRGKRTLKAGEYAFEHSASTLDVYNRLARGDVYSHTVVVPEGFNIFDIADALEAAKVCKRDDFLRVAQTDTSLIADIDPEAKTLEGYLFPDTYNISRSQTPRDVAATMVKRFRQNATTIGLNTNVHRTVTLASIVEKETGVKSERPLVAGVFENRLAHHIGLATDPSVIYASLLIGKFDGTIHQSDLALDSPYNTYKNAGLPPGPIANPGRESLKAAMQPTQTDYLYFVANNLGGHNFARTIEEHNHNVALYRQGLAKAGNN
ncbi:MAG: aminodeoxychorismate lyase [Acidobacteriales bacterium]|nr:aminodeoxychorismate lyase [Terriglobales bacterium]